MIYFCHPKNLEEIRAVLHMKKRKLPPDAPMYHSKPKKIKQATK